MKHLCSVNNRAPPLDFFHPRTKTLPTHVPTPASSSPPPQKFPRVLTPFPRQLQRFLAVFALPHCATYLHSLPGRTTSRMGNPAAGHACRHGLGRQRCSQSAPPFPSFSSHWPPPHCAPAPAVGITAPRDRASAGPSPSAS